MIYLDVNEKYCIINPDVAAIEKWLNENVGRRYSTWDWIITGYRFNYRRLIRLNDGLEESDILYFILKFG